MSDKIQRQGLAQVQGGGFNPNSEVMPVSRQQGGSNNFWTKLVPELGKIAVDLYERENNYAKIQGQIDYISGSLQEQSWLTQKGYQRGADMQQYADAEAGFQSTLAKLSKQAQDEGKDLNSFTDSLKPHIQELSKLAYNLNVPRESQAAFQKSIVSTVSLAQQTFNKESERRQILEEQRTIQGMAVGASQSIQNSGFTAEAVGLALQQVYDKTYSLVGEHSPKEAGTEASKAVLGSWMNAIGSLDSMDGGTPAMLGQMQSWLNSDKAAYLDVEVVTKLHDSIDKKITEVQEHNSVSMVAEMETLESRIENGDLTDPNTIKSFEQEILNKYGNKTISSGTAKEMLRKIGSNARILDSKVGEKQLALEGRLEDLLVAGKTPEWQAAYVLKENLKRFGGDIEQAATATILQGKSTANMATVEAGSKVLADRFVSGFTMTDAERAKADDGTQGKAWSTYATQLRAAKGKDQLTYDAMLNSLPASIRSAVELAANETSEGTQPNYLVDAEKVRKAAVRLEDMKANGVSMNIKFTPDDMKSSMWGGNEKGAEVFHQPSESTRSVQAIMLTQHYNRNAAKLASDGLIIYDSTSAIREMTKRGMLVRLPNGNMPMTPEFTNAVSSQLGAAMNMETFKSTVNKEMDKYVKAGGGKYAKDNVVVSVSGTDVVMVGYDSKGVAVGQQYRVGAGSYAKAMNNTIKSDAKVSTGKTLGTIQMKDGNSMYIDKRWGTTFKNNNLGVAIAKELYRNEGFLNTPAFTNKKGDPAKTRVVGLGVAERSHPTMWDKAVKASKSPESYAPFAGEFAQYYFKNYSSYVQQAGLPPTDPSTIDTRKQTAYVAIADAQWHGGDGGGSKMASILRVAQTDTSKAMAMLEKQAFYTQAVGGSGNLTERNKMLRRAVEVMGVRAPRY